MHIYVRSKLIIRVESCPYENRPIIIFAATRWGSIFAPEQVPFVELFADRVRIDRTHTHGS
jgi:hypothetical protein